MAHPVFGLAELRAIIAFHACDRRITFALPTLVGELPDQTAVINVHASVADATLTALRASMRVFCRLRRLSRAFSGAMYFPDLTAIFWQFRSLLVALFTNESGSMPPFGMVSGRRLLTERLTEEKHPSLDACLAGRALALFLTSPFGQGVVTYPFAHDNRCAPTLTDSLTLPDFKFLDTSKIRASDVMKRDYCVRHFQTYVRRRVEADAPIPLVYVREPMMVRYADAPVLFADLALDPTYLLQFSWHTLRHWICPAGTEITTANLLRIFYDWEARRTWLRIETERLLELVV